MEEMIAMVYELISSLLSLAWSVLPVIGMWLVFEKAGEKGWKAVIPFYNVYIMLKLADKKKYWGMYLAGTIIYLVAAGIVIFYLMWFMVALIMAFGAVDLGWEQMGQLGPFALVSALVCLAGYVLMWIPTIHGYAGICKKMGQGIGMVIGLIFLGPIFWMILGAGKEYQWQHDAPSAECVANAYQPPTYQEPAWQEPFNQDNTQQKGDNEWSM